MKKIVTASLILILLLTLAQVVVSNTLSTTGVTLGGMEDQISAYKKENEILREQLLTASSLTTISQKAEKLGFVAQTSPLAISSSMPIAERP